MRKHLAVAFALMAMLSAPLQVFADAPGITKDDVHSVQNTTEYYDPNNPACASGGAPAGGGSGDIGPLTGSGNVEQAYNFFTSPPRSLTPTEAAAIVGNFYVEAPGVNPNEPNGGIAQWLGDRWTALQSFAAAHHANANDLAVQLAFSWQELSTSYKSAITTMAADGTDVNKATEDFMLIYEGPSIPHLDRRQLAARKILHQYGGGAAGPPVAPPGAGSPAGCSSCPDSGSSGNTIVLDPGHSPSPTQQTDPASGIETEEGSGAPGEMHAMWQTAQTIKTKLEADGYKVVLTKNSEDDTAGFVTKVARADAANASLAVSLHYTGGASFGVANDHYGVTPQQVGRYRENSDNGKRKTFTDSSQAAESLKDAQAIADERNKTGDTTKVAPLDQSFPASRGLPAFGDISIVQLLSDTPWVYNEAGANGFNETKYATGITNGIEKAVPLDGAGGSPGAAAGCASGSIAAAVQKAMDYAWADGVHGDPQKPSYAAAVATAQAKGEYVGGTVRPGNDCGGFVTRVMQDSGADPNYNYGTDASKQGNTTQQLLYLRTSGKYQDLGTVTDTSSLQPGDIAIFDGGGDAGHTYMYVGPQSSHPDFQGNSASASIPDRSPNASNAYFTEGSNKFEWFRLKSGG